MKCTTGIICTLAGVLLLASCNNVDFKKTKGGMPYKLYEGKGTVKSAVGNVIKLNFKRTLNDSVMYSSYGTMPVYVPVSGDSQPYDVSELLVGLKKGDSIYAVQAVDTFLKRSPMNVPPFFKAGMKMNTHIKVLEVFKTQQEAQADEEKERMTFARSEEAVIMAYLAKNNIKAEKSPKGTYVQVLDPGTGAPVLPGKFVSVMYRGSTFSGTMFDTNMDSSKGHTEPLQYVVAQGQMIPGFDDGVQLLKEGAKAKLYIPSMLAYGPQPPSPVIKPFENLIFDVQVLKVENAPPPAPNPQGPPPQKIDTAQSKR